MRNRTYGGVRGRKTKVGRKLLRFPPTRFIPTNSLEMLGRKFVGKTMVIGVISIARRRGKPW